MKTGNMVAVCRFNKRDGLALFTAHATGNAEVTRKGDEQSFQHGKC